MVETDSQKLKNRSKNIWNVFPNNSDNQGAFWYQLDNQVTEKMMYNREIGHDQLIEV